MNPITASVRRRQFLRSKAKMEELARRPEAQAVRAVLATPAGGALLKYLEEVFVMGDLLGDDAEETAFNLGSREVVMELRRLRDRTITTTTETGESHA
jgi:hypothetical protein